MFERFTEEARQVVVFAQEEAHTLRHDYIGTEHLLLGLLRVDGAAARALDQFDVTLEEVRAQVARIVGLGDEVSTGQIPFTPRAKKVLELSLREALDNGDNHIRPEHILLGLVSEGEGVAARILTDFAQLGAIRAAALDVSAADRAGQEFAPESPPLAAEVIEELRQVRAAKERAVDDQQFDRATELRGRERRLRTAARNLQLAWLDEEPVYLLEPRPNPIQGTMPGKYSEHIGRRVFGPLLVGWTLFGVALGVGLLIGWAIWGS
jgi:ATP-dependent Clp protease ATP-binding subunit ClpA